MKVYVMCPAASYTGGPTLAHQLCHILNKNGITSEMWYFCSKRKQKTINPVHPNYVDYHNPYTFNKPSDIEDNMIIALESKTDVLRRFKKAKKAIWWMSVDNYFLNFGGIIMALRKKYLGFKPTIEYCKKYQHKKKYQTFKQQDIIHLIQSEYARLFLISEGISKDKIFELSDYVEDEVCEASSRINYANKKDNILYNPKKGIEFTQKIIEHNKNYNWIPLIGMSKEQIIDAMLESKLYIDFGNHPGKDRFPREAVLCGCCILTGRRGSAANDKDVPISNEYKFDDREDALEDISNKISEIMANYSVNIENFEDYKKRTLKEKEIFEEEVKSIFCK